MKKSLSVIIFVLIAAIVLTIFLIRFFSGENFWLCQNNEWVKHGYPRVPKPNIPCGIKPPEKENEVVVFSPQVNAVVNSPLVTEGKARGFWFFEASFPVKLLDEQGKELARGIVQATDDWMTTNFVPFKGELKFNPTSAKKGVLVLEKDNPSGLPEYDKKFEVPIQFSFGETTKIKVYFNNNNLDPEFSCNKVFPVEREVTKTQAIARVALEELLKGATETEKAQGFFTSINPSVKIQKLTIANGVAKVDFDEQLEFQMGGSCRVAAIRAQITETLKQFPTVEEVIISVNGRTEDILQP